MCQLNKAVVIDNGSGICKCGMSGDEAPMACFPAVIGRPKFPSILCTGNQKEDIFIGNEANSKRGVLNIDYPIQNGIITNWDDMQLIWQHVYYNELRVMSNDHPVMLTQAPRNPKNNRQKMTQIMFETFNVPAYYVAIQAILTLYSSGRTKGIVLDSGDGVTHTVPVFQGYAMPHAVQRVNMAGRTLTNYMQKLLNEIGINLQYSAEIETVKDIKQKLGYVALDYDSQMLKVNQKTYQNTLYQMPDGQVINVGSQKFRCPEALFKPINIGMQIDGIHQIIYNSIKKCDLDVRKQLYSNIIMSGGSTMFPGITERLTKEMTKLVPPTMKIKVNAPPERKFSVWIGGAMLAFMASFQDSWIKKTHYQQSGPSIVHRMCF